MPLSEQTEKIIRVGFKIATALAIPAIVWSLNYQHKLLFFRLKLTISKSR